MEMMTSRTDVPTLVTRPVPASTTSAASFDRLYQERYHALVRLAYLMVGDNGVAEEVVQDAFARAHLRWSRLHNPGAYVHVAVLNGARNEVRRLVRRRGKSLPVPDDHVDETSVELLDALRVLNGRQRAAVVLRFYEGRSEAEIAELLGVRPGTVKSLIHRALNRLREVIEL
jgi:RNA polymerase sigma-70 factor (sigma-E family)